MDFIVKLMDFVIDNWDKIATVIFACFSAVFAGISAWILWLEYRRNNPQIKVYVERGLFSNLQMCVKCRITNVGRRSVNIVALKFITNTELPHSTIGGIHEGSGKGGTFSGKNILIRVKELPFFLDEHQFKEIDILFDWMLKYLMEQKASVEKVCFEDSTGKLYCLKISKKAFPEFFYSENMYKKLKNWVHSKFKHLTFKKMLSIHFHF